MFSGKKNKIAGTYIDLFSGCGGFSLGLGNAGWQGIFAVEKDSMAFETFKHNLIDGKYGHFNWPEWLPQKETTIQTLLKNHKEQLEIIIFRGFSSSTTHPIEIDSEKKVIALNYEIKNFKLYKAPLTETGENFIRENENSVFFLNQKNWI